MPASGEYEQLVELVTCSKLAAEVGWALRNSTEEQGGLPPPRIALELLHHEIHRPKALGLRGMRVTLHTAVDFFFAPEYFW